MTEEQRKKIIQAALAEGYTPDEILDYLEGTQKLETFGQPEVPDPVEELKKIEAQAQLERISTGEISAGLSEDEAKKARAKTDAERILTQLEDAYFGGNNGQGLAYGRKEGIKQFVAAKAGKNADLNVYLGLRESLRPTFARAAGDVGNLSKSEQDRAVAVIPTGLNTIEEAIKFFKVTRIKFGLPERNISTIAPQYSESFNKIKSSDSYDILGYSEKDIEPPKKSQLEKILPTAGLAAATAASFAPPVGPLAFLKGAGLVGRAALAGGITGATQGEGGIGERLRGATTGALGGATLGAVLRPLQTVRKIGGIARSQVSKGAILSTKPAIEAAKKYAEDVPLAKGTLEKILPSLQKTKNITLQQAEGKLDKWWSLARTKSNDVKSTAQANLYDALFQGLRGELAKKAPRVSAARTASFGVQKAQRLGRGVFKTGANIAPWFVGGYLFNKLIGRE